MFDQIIYTDGGCHGNPGPGAWAYRLVDGNGTVVKADSGYEHATTNNRMELMAVISALRFASGTFPSVPFTVVTDSEYVRKGITEWIERWRRNGWRTTGRKPVKNEDLWRTLDALAADMELQWAWVKGHAGNEHNEACDQMVQQEIYQQKQS